MSNSLWPQGLWHTRLPCPSLSPRVCSNSCPLSQWCHPTTSSIVTPFSSCPQYFQWSGSFPKSQPFASGGQSTRTSASASLLPVNIQSWFPLELTGLISLVSKGLLQHLVWEERLLPLPYISPRIFYGLLMDFAPVLRILVLFSQFCDMTMIQL